jgi:hypothetical protein
MVQTSIKQDPVSKTTNTTGADRWAQVIEHQPSKCKALNLMLSTTEKKRKKEGREGGKEGRKEARKEGRKGGRKRKKRKKSRPVPDIFLWLFISPRKK